MVSTLPHEGAPSEVHGGVDLKKKLVQHLVATSSTVKDQASKDSRAAAEGKIDDPGAKPLKAVVTRLPEE